MKIHRATNHDRTTAAIIEAVAEAVDRADWRGNDCRVRVDFEACGGPLIRLKTRGRRFELRLIEEV